jgi:hypothetical protein
MAQQTDHIGDVNKMVDHHIVDTNKMITAVEWLYKLSKQRELDKFDLEQAKAMEKEQRIKDYNVGYDDAQCNHINDADNYANEIEYLNDK